MVDNIAIKWWESDAETISLLAKQFDHDNVDDVLNGALGNARNCSVAIATDPLLKARFDLIAAAQLMHSAQPDCTASPKRMFKRVIDMVDSSSPIAIIAKIYRNMLKAIGCQDFDSLTEAKKREVLNSLLEDCKKLKEVHDNLLIYNLVSSFEKDFEKLSIVIPDELSFEASPFESDLMLRFNRAKCYYEHYECVALLPNTQKANAFAAKAVQVFEALKFEGCVGANQELSCYYNDTGLLCHNKEKAAACWQAILEADNGIFASGARAHAAYSLSLREGIAPGESLRLLRLSVELGDESAVSRLGSCYEFGDELLGVELNVQKAFEIYQQGYDSLMANRDACFLHVPTSVTKLVESYFKGSEALSREKDISKALDLLYAWVVSNLHDGDRLHNDSFDLFENNQAFSDLFYGLMQEVQEANDTFSTYCCALIKNFRLLGRVFRHGGVRKVGKLTDVDLFKCVLRDRYHLKRIKQSWLQLLWDSISKTEGQRKNLLKALEGDEETLECLCQFLTDRGDSLVQAFRKGCHAEKVGEANLSKMLQEAVDYYDLVPESSALALRSIESMLLLLSFPVLGIRGDIGGKDNFMTLCSDDSVKALIEKYNRTLTVRTLLSESEQQTKRVVNKLLAEWHKKAGLDLPVGIHDVPFGLQAAKS